MLLFLPLVVPILGKINNRELPSNPNLDSLWKSRFKKNLGRVGGFCPSTCYSRGWKISGQDRGLPLCPAWSLLWLQPPGLAALPLPWEACPMLDKMLINVLLLFFFSFPITFKFQHTTRRNLMNLHDKKIPKIYRALLAFGLGFDFSSKSPEIL